MIPIRLLFFGTSDFAVPVFNALAKDARFHIVATITQPDRPVGRQQTLEQTSIKKISITHGVPVFTFENLRATDAYEALHKIHFDAAVVASFGQIIPQRLLDLAPQKFLNVHASLLPSYRGASPIAAAIRNGESETGVSIMVMDARMDHGATLAMQKESIRPDDTTGRLSERLALRGALLLSDCIVDYLKGRLQAIPQNESQATYVKLLTREDGRLDPTQQTAAEMERMMRAYDPWPGTYYEWNGRRIKILQAVLGKKTEGFPGARVIENGQPALVSMDGVSLLLTRVVPDGKKPMDGSAYGRGHHDWIKQEGQ